MNELPSFSYANELRLQEKFSDVVLKVGQRRFSCHRIVLASASKYFLNMFTKNYNEASKNEIELNDFNADDFELIITHIYGGSLSLNDENAYPLLRLSIYLNLKKLEELCTKFLIESCSLSPRTALRIFAFASRTASAKLLDTFTKHVAKNFVSLWKNERFLYFSGEELLKILAHPDLNAEVGTILHFLVDWMKFQPTDDKKLLPRLLSATNLTKIPDEWLEERLKESTITSKKMSQDNEEKTKENEIDSDTTYLDIFEENTLFSESDDAETTEIKLPFTVFFGGKRGENESCVNVCKLESPNTGNLQSLIIQTDPHTKSKVEICRAALVNNVPLMLTVTHSFLPVNSADDAYATSESEDYGYANGISRNNAYFRPYFFHEDKSYAMEPCVEYNNDSLFTDARMVVSDVEVFLYYNGSFRIFNCQDNKWSHEGPPSDGFIKTVQSDLLVYQNSLYVIGGEILHRDSEKEDHGKVFEQYDKREGKWQQLPRMNYAHYQAASCVYDDILYVSGGSNLNYFKGIIETYDFKAGKWGLLETSMIKSKMDHSVVAYDKQLWFLGGKNYKSNVHGTVPDLTWFSYNLEENKWSDIYSLPKTIGDFETREIFHVLEV